MKQLAALALAVALVAPAIASPDRCECKGCCPCVDQVRHNFGVDVGKLRKDGVEMTLPPQLLRVFDSWTDMPSRLEEAAYHGALVGTGFAWVAIGALWFALRKAPATT